MLCWFLLYNKVNQLQLHIYPLPLEPLCHPTRYPSQPSRSSQSTKLNSLFYTAASHYIFYIWQCVCMCACVYKCMCVCAESLSHVRLFSPPLTVAHPAPLSMGVLQAGLLEWAASASLSVLPTLSFSSLCPQVHCLCLHIYSCLANRFIWTIFLDSIYALICNTCFSPSDLLLSVYSLQIHPCHYN